ncbi:hypothetical protein P3T27_007255 [Kitasatospora sp. MAA19]|nr:hypothetical protein [Kitasatospora sp. MAA19]
MVGASVPVVVEGGGAGEFGGDVLHGAVVGGGDDDLVAGQPRVECRDEARVDALAVPAAPGAADERLLGPFVGGHHGGPFDDEGGDQVAQHGGLAGTGRAVDREQAAVGSGAVGEHAVDRELLAERERVPRLGGPAAGGYERGVDARQDGATVLAQVGAGVDGDVPECGQVGVQGRAEAVPEPGADPGEVRWEEAVEERLCGGGLGFGVARAVDEPTADTDHARVEEVLDAAQVGDLGGQRDEVGERDGAQARVGPVVGRGSVGGGLRRRRGRPGDGRALLVDALARGAAGRRPVRDPAHQRFRRPLEGCAGDLAEQRADRRHGGAAQDLREQLPPAARRGGGLRHGFGARGGGLRWRAGRARVPGRVGDRDGGQPPHRHLERLAQLLEAVQPPGRRRARIEEAARRPAARGDDGRALDRPPVLVQDQGEHRALPRQHQFLRRHPRVRVGALRQHRDHRLAQQLQVEHPAVHLVPPHHPSWCPPRRRHRMVRRPRQRRRHLADGRRQVQDIRVGGTGPGGALSARYLRDGRRAEQLDGSPTLQQVCHPPVPPLSGPHPTAPRVEPAAPSRFVCRSAGRRIYRTGGGQAEYPGQRPAAGPTASASASGRPRQPTPDARGHTQRATPAHAPGTPRPDGADT